MAIPTDLEQRLRRLQTLSRHAERAAGGLAEDTSLERLLPEAQPEGLTRVAASKLLAAHDFDVERALAAYRAGLAAR